MTADIRHLDDLHDDLRRHLAPGDMVYVVQRGASRSGAKRYLGVYGPEMRHDLTEDVAAALCLEVRNGALIARAPFGAKVVTDLSTALFGRPDALKWRTV